MHIYSIYVNIFLRLNSFDSQHICANIFGRCVFTIYVYSTLDTIYVYMYQYVNVNIFDIEYNCTDLKYN